MSISSTQSDYTVIFAQRQELFIQDCLRKLFDIEVKLTLANATINEWKEKYEESQKQVQLQNEMMSQAAASIESITVQNKNVSSENDRFSKTIKELEIKIIELSKSEEKLKNQVELSNSRIRDLEKELVRQREELQLMFDGPKVIEETKTKPLPKKKVNTKPEAIEPETDENIF